MQRPKATLTGFAKTFDPKNGDSWIIGKNLPRKSNRSDRASKGFVAKELLRNKST